MSEEEIIRTRGVGDIEGGYFENCARFFIFTENFSIGIVNITTGEQLPHECKTDQLPELHNDTSARSKCKAHRFKPQILIVTFGFDLRSILVL